MMNKASLSSVCPYKLARILVQCLEYISSIQAKEVPILAPDTTIPSTNIVSLVEDINEKAMQALKILDTTNGTTQTLPLITVQLPQAISITPLGIPRRSRVLLVGK
jgi:hypothetical protein